MEENPLSATTSPFLRREGAPSPPDTARRFKQGAHDALVPHDVQDLDLPSADQEKLQGKYDKIVEVVPPLATNAPIIMICTGSLSVPRSTGTLGAGATW